MRSWQSLAIGEWYSYNDRIWLKLLFAEKDTFTCSECIIDDIYAVKEHRFPMLTILKRVDHYQIEHDPRAMKLLTEANISAIEAHENKHKAFWKKQGHMSMDLEVNMNMDPRDLIHYHETLDILPLDTSGSLSLQKVEPNKLHIALTKHLI